MSDSIKLVKILTSSDGATFQEAKCAFFGKVQTLKMLGMYGISYRPPDNSFGVAFSANNYDNNIFIVADRPKLRFTGLEKGELQIGNYLTGASILFKVDGTIEITPKSGEKVKVMGALEVSGKVETLTDFESPSVPSYDAHVHSGVTSGGSNTGGPQ